MFYSYLCAKHAYFTRTSLPSHYTAPAAVETLNTHETQAHISFGNSNFSSWCILIFPLIYKKIRLVIFIVIAFTASVVDMSLILAPSTPSTLAVRILQIYQSSDIDSFFIASNLALIQLLIIIILLLSWMILERIVEHKLFFIFFMKILSFKIFFLKNLIFASGTILFSLSVLGIFSSLLWGFSKNWYFPSFFPNSIDIDTFINFYNEIFRHHHNSSEKERRHKKVTKSQI